MSEQPWQTFSDQRQLPVEVPFQLVDEFDPTVVGVWVWVSREEIRKGRRLLLNEVRELVLEQGMSFSVFRIAKDLHRDGWLNEPEAIASESVKNPQLASIPKHQPRIDGDANTKQHVVYQHFAEDGQLLYVGVSSNIKSRLKSHRSSPWWDQVASIRIDVASSRGDALRAELELILKEQPPYNKSDRAYASDRVLQSELAR